MKNLLKKNLLIVALLFAVVTKATNINNNVKVAMINSKLIDLKLENSDGDLRISIKDIYGEVLYAEKFEGNYFSKKYDLNALPIGNYYFEIEGRTRINLMPFKLTSSGFEHRNQVKSTFYKPIVRQEEDLVFISKIAFNTEDFEVYLYDEQLNLLYKENLKGDINLGKTLNLKNLKSGNYKIVMKSEGKVFEQKIYKK
jgi:hypothetical protein